MADLNAPLRDPPEMLAGLRAIAAEVLTTKAQIDPDLAAHAAHEIMLAFAEHWGGDSVYVPKADTLQRHSRDVAIWEEFTGDNHAALARKYRISKVWVYAIVKRMGRLEADRRQGKLFVAEQQAAEQQAA